jgi:hypothetical protein
MAVFVWRRHRVRTGGNLPGRNPVHLFHHRIYKFMERSGPLQVNLNGILRKHRVLWRRD